MLTLVLKDLTSVKDWVLTPFFDFLSKWFKFLDTFIGRGSFLIVLGFRCMPLGKHFNIVVGALTLLFGIVHLILQYFSPYSEFVEVQQEEEEEEEEEDLNMLDTWGAKASATSASLGSKKAASKPAIKPASKQDEGGSEPPSNAEPANEEERAAKRDSAAKNMLLRAGRRK